MRPVAGDDAVAGEHLLVEPEVGGAVGDEPVELDEAALVEQQVEPLARGELALLVLLRDARGAPALLGLGLAVMELLEQLSGVGHGGRRYRRRLMGEKSRPTPDRAAFHCIAIRMRARPLGWSYQTALRAGPGSSFRYSASLRAISAKPSGCRAALSPKMSAAASFVPDVGVEDRRQEEQIDGEDQREQREPAGSSTPRIRPAGAPAHQRPRRTPSGAAANPDRDHEREEHDELVDVVEHVMARLVTHHRLDLGQRRRGAAGCR